MPRTIPVRPPRVGIALVIITSLLVVLMVIIINTRSGGRTDATDQAMVARGKSVYSTNCASCHGATLAGQPNWKEPLPSGLFPAPPHDASGHTWHHPDRLLFKLVNEGGASALLPGDQSGMPAFGSVLTEQDIWAVLSFIKSTWPPEIQERQTDVSRQTSE